jgi:hypothetical protein
LLLGRTAKLQNGGLTPQIAAALKQAAAEKATLKAKAALVKTTKEQTKAIKEQTALQKAGTLFDLEQTQVIAALKGNISYDERKRLELQLALLTGNTAEASLLAGKLAYSQGLTKELVAFYKNLPDAKNPFAGWAAYLDAIEAQVMRIALGNGSDVLSEGSMTSGAIPGSTQVFPGDFGGGGAAGAPVTVVVNVGGSVISEGELVDVVRNGLLSNSLSGSPSAIGRLRGSFLP